jgi:hypothetical protein
MRSYTSACLVLPLLMAHGAACSVDQAGSASQGGWPGEGGPGASDDGSAAAPGMESGTPDDDGSAPGLDAGSSRDAAVDTGAPGHPDAGPPALTGQACASPPCINVLNACPFPLWIHAVNNPGTTPVTLMPDDAKIEPLGQTQYSLPASWPAARINAYWQEPTAAGSDPSAFDKVELTYGSGTMNYNITYVDYLALPARMEAVDPACPKTSTFDPLVGCDVPVAGVLTGCPSGLLDGNRCLSAGLYCSDASHQSQALCHALDATLAQCEQENASTCGMAAQLGNGTPNAYSCSGYFDSQGGHTDGNKWCAALNRGMLAAPDSTDTTQYYQAAPYNAYARWVHDTCPGIYAFAYDDYPAGAGQSGFRSCQAARLDVTFCPGG